MRRNPSADHSEGVITVTGHRARAPGSCHAGASPRGGMGPNSVVANTKLRSVSASGVKS